MAFAQLTYRESLRDIEACLRAQRSKLYHLGFRANNISRNTLANANATRDWRIYAQFAQRLIAIARRLYANESFGVDLKHTVYALDSTLIDLCLTLFPWTPSQQSKAGVRLHTLLDLRGPIPSFLYISEARFAEINILDQLIPEPGAFYLFDRGYLDFTRLHRFQLAGSFFVTRGKAKLSLKRRYSHRVDRSSGLICDQTVVLSFHRSKAGYPEPLRRIRFKDPASGNTLVFLTNHFGPAGGHHLRAVSLSLADRVVLQVDQATFANQSLLRQHGQRSEDPNLDRHQHLRARRHYEKGTGHRPQPLRNFANPECHAFRKNPYFSGLNRVNRPKPKSHFP